MCYTAADVPETVATAGQSASVPGKLGRFPQTCRIPMSPLCAFFTCLFSRSRQCGEAGKLLRSELTLRRAFEEDHSRPKNQDFSTSGRSAPQTSHRCHGKCRALQKAGVSESSAKQTPTANPAILASCTPSDQSGGSQVSQVSS